MSIKYEIRQHVSTVKSGWLVTVYETEYERVAHSEFEKLLHSNPNNYFELVMVEHKVTALNWTGKKEHSSERNKPSGAEV